MRTRARPLLEQDGASRPLCLSPQGWRATPIAPGAPADLGLFKARGWSELLSRPQADRVVLRAGRPIDRMLPDYRELDHIYEPPRATSVASSG